MHNVRTHKQRYAVWSLLYSEMLQTRNLLHSLYIEKSSYISLQYKAVKLRTKNNTGLNITPYWKVQLTDFFFKCHLRHQIVNI